MAPKELQQQEERGGIVGYFVGIQQEWGRISWPTGLSLLVNILVVFTVTAIATIFVWSCDLLFRSAIAAINPA